MTSDLPAGRDVWVWCITPDGGLAIDRCADDGQGRVVPASGGSITRQKIIARRSTAEARSWPFLAAVTSLILEDLVAQARAYAGFGIPDWLAAEMRHALLEQVRDGRLVLAGKLSPVQAEAPWVRFDPTALGAWDFGFDDTARPIIGPGASYVSVTAFTPDEWERVRKAKGKAPKPPLAAAVEWMRKAYSGERKPKGTDAIRDCANEVGVLQREAKAALVETLGRRRRGRPRGGRA